jgi:sugar fermentation stimulation protein A
MRFTGDFRDGRFIRRLNRFAGEVAIGGRRVLAHIPNSGRLGELLVPGAHVLLRRARGAQRQTAYDLLLVIHGGRWVCIDARLPSRLVEEALKGEGVGGLKGYRVERREIPLPGGRIDLCLSGAPGPCYVETKAVTLVVGRTAVFPDAPTERGRRHLEALCRTVRRGGRAAVVFVVLRSDARRFAPNWRTDPCFAGALAQAVDAGVQVIASACRITRKGMHIARTLPLSLVPPGADTVFGLDIRRVSH